MQHHQIDIQNVCSQLTVGTLIKYLDIYSITLDDPTMVIANALPNECVGVIIDVFAAMIENSKTGEEKMFWNYEVYRTEGFREVITNDDVEWLAANENFKILWSPRTLSDQKNKDEE